MPLRSCTMCGELETIQLLVDDLKDNEHASAYKSLSAS